MINKIKNILSSDEKNEEVLVNSFFSLIIKGAGFLVTFISMPLYISYFDNQAVLGIWFTVISVLGWILTFDLGLGNGLRNMLVEPLLNNDYKKAKGYISSAYFIVFILAISLCLIGGIAIQFVDWNSILNIDENIISNNIFKLCITILYTGILLSFVLKIVNSILYAMQKTAINNAIMLATSMIPLIYLFVARDSGIAVNFIKLSIVNMIANCLPLLIATIYVFACRFRECIPSIKAASKKVGLSILKYGGAFFIIQIFFILIISTNEIFITKLFGPELVVEYQIYFRIFTAIGSIVTLALAPLWSAVTKAIAQKDYSWIKKIYKLLNKVLIGATILEFIAIVFLQKFVDIWLGTASIKINYVYSVIFAIFGSLFVWNIIVTTIANGTGKLKTQLYGYSIGAILKVVIILILCNVYNDWIVTIVANSLVLLIFCIIQSININKFIQKGSI